MTPEMRKKRELCLKFEVDILSNYTEEGQILSITDIIQNMGKINNHDFLEENKLIIKDVFIFLKQTDVLKQIDCLRSDGTKSVQFQLTKHGKKFIDLFIREGDESEIDENDELFLEIKETYTKLGYDENGKKIDKNLSS